MTVQEFFSKQVAVAVKSTLTKDTQTKSNILIKVIQSQEQETRSKSLDIQLTDEQDPFFLYHLEITEEDFHIIKQEQGLLVDFVQFPFKFIELLEACITSDKSEHPKFIAQLNHDQSERFSIFNIIESNSFKNINHLSLKLCSANDNSLKQYLAKVVKQLKSDKAQLIDSLSKSTQSTREADLIISKLNTELNELKKTSAQDISDIKIQHSIQVAAEKEKFTIEKDAFRERLESEMKANTEKHDLQMKKITDQFHELSLSNSQNLKHTQILESNLIEATKKIESLTQELSFSRQECERLMTQKSHVDNTNLFHTKKAETLEKNLRETQERERHAVDNFNKSNEKLLIVQEQLKREQDTISVLKHQIERHEEGLSKASEEISKGNDIIRRLQGDLKNSKAKLKLKNVVTLQQEKLLDERAATIEGLHKDFAVLNESNTKHLSQIKDLEERNQKLSDSIVESKKIIEDNNRVIEWLHKQLNEEALNRPISGIRAGYTAIDFSKYNNSENLARATPTNFNRHATTEMTQTPKFDNTKDYSSGINISPRLKSRATERPASSTQNHSPILTQPTFPKQTFTTQVQVPKKSSYFYSDGQ